MEDFILKHFQLDEIPSGKSRYRNSPEERAQTKRGQRVSDLMKGRHNQESAERNPGYLDTMIRKQLGELVRLQIESNHLDALEAVLKEHQSFISDILNLIEKKKRQAR